MKYTIESLRPRLEQFLTPLLNRAGFEVSYELRSPENPHPEVENPEVTVVFSGDDVELLLANRAELLVSARAPFDGSYPPPSRRSFSRSHSMPMTIACCASKSCA